MLKFIHVFCGNVVAGCHELSYVDSEHERPDVGVGGGVGGGGVGGDVGCPTFTLALCVHVLPLLSVTTSVAV
jgi:hypothetical protein